MEPVKVLFLWLRSIVHAYDGHPPVFAVLSLEALSYFTLWDRSVTLWTMAIATTIVTDLDMSTSITGIDVTTESNCTAIPDRPKCSDLPTVEA